MPGFFLKDGRHFVTYITGPAHVLLGVRFAWEAGEPRLVRQEGEGGKSNDALDASRILEAVQEVLAARRAEGLGLFAEEIVYVADDSPRYDLYRIAAELLAERYLAGGEFTPVPRPASEAQRR